MGEGLKRARAAARATRESISPIAALIEVAKKTDALIEAWRVSGKEPTKTELMFLQSEARAALRAAGVSPT